MASMERNVANAPVATTPAVLPPGLQSRGAGARADCRPPPSSGQTVSLPFQEDDATAVQIRLAMDRLSGSLAKAAARLHASKSWVDLGFARLDDYALERLQRSGRWVRDLAAIGRACQEWPELARALSGADGGETLGLVAARLLAHLAEHGGGRGDEGWRARWLALARGSTVRQLRDAVRAALAADDGAHRMFSGDDPRERRQIRLLVPSPVRAAVEETLDLYRALEGRKASLTEFIEALTAEAAGSVGASGERTSLALAPTTEEETRDGSHCGNGSSTQGDCTPACEAQDAPEEQPGADDPDAHLRTLLGLQDALERQLGRVLARMADAGAWRRLGFAGLGHYAEERLGLARSSARDRAFIARSLRRLPRLRVAYDKGEIGFSAALVIVRAIGGAAMDDAGERAWVAHGRRTTVKRLEDEARTLGREGGPARPLHDQAWHRSLRREAGTARSRLKDLARKARGAPLVPLNLSLPAEVAAGFASAMEDARSRAHRMFSSGDGTVPLWAGLMTLLVEFVEIWDVDPSARRPAQQAIYIEAGWRCMAPGCSSRRNLESHHVVYRSRGGGDEAANRICLCRFHHQMGEHDGRMRVRGQAPLGLIWRMGRGGRGGLFRNERRL